VESRGVEASSGDSGWWFDFSSVVTPGTYFIYDDKNNARSAVFHIEKQVYKNILKAAVRMYFYQRSGFAKQPPYADECWKDAPAYIGPGRTPRPTMSRIETTPARSEI